jgi:hypothetical protein
VSARDLNRVDGTPVAAAERHFGAGRMRRGPKRYEETAAPAPSYSFAEAFSPERRFGRDQFMIPALRLFAPAVAKRQLGVMRPGFHVGRGFRGAHPKPPSTEAFQGSGKRPLRYEAHARRAALLRVLSQTAAFFQRR